MAENNLSYPFAERLLGLIYRDISALKNANINPSRIRISMPRWIKGILESYCKEEITERYFQKLHNEHDKWDTLFGVELVAGYNHTVCVFDDFADVNDLILDPIICFPNFKSKKEDHFINHDLK